MTPPATPSPDAAQPNDGAGRAEPEFLIVGHVTRAHGIKGEVLVTPLTDHEEEVFSPGNEMLLGDADGELEDDSPLLTVGSVRPYKRGLLVRFEGVEDRTTAETMAKRYLLVPSEALGPLEEGEVYYHQLLGMTVVTVTGEEVGRVREVFETEPAHLLEVKAKGRTHLTPFVERIVREIDLERGRLVIEPPPGLLEI